MTWFADFDSILSNPVTGHGQDGYYFAENGEYSLYEAFKAISMAMVELTQGEGRELTPFTEELIQDPGVRLAGRLVCSSVDILVCSALCIQWHKLSLPRGSLPGHWVDSCEVNHRFLGEH